MIFTNTKSLSPIIYENDLPHKADLFHVAPESIPTSLSERRKFITKGGYIKDRAWWNRQYQRCIHGYSIDNAIEKGGDAFIDGIDCIWDKDDCYIPQYDLMIKDRVLKISGRYYWFLNFWKIYGKIMNEARKGMITPRFLDIQFYLQRRMEMMFEQSLDASELKRRQVGWSEAWAGMGLAYNFTFIPSSFNVVVGGTEDDAEHTMSNAIRGLNDLINSQFYKERDKDKSDHIRGKNNKAQIRGITAKDNTQAVSRFTPSLIIYEEVGKWKKDAIQETRGFVNASLQAEGVKTGFSVYIATGGDMDMGAADMEIIHYNPEQFGNLQFNNQWEKDENAGTTKTGHFIPAYLFRIIDENGNSKKQESLKDLHEERDLKSKKEKYVHTTQFPTYASEAFQITGGGFFGETIAQMCNERKAEINIHRELRITTRAKLTWKTDLAHWYDGVKMEPCEDGPFIIAEKPLEDKNGNVYENLYKIGTDSYDQSEALTSSSKGCAVVKKSFLQGYNTAPNMWVAMILERPTMAEGGREIFYENTALLTAYYRGINLIEHSKILIFDWYMKNNLFPLLKEKPSAIYARKQIQTLTTNDFGLDASFIPHALKMLRDDIHKQENIDNIFFTEMLTAFAMFKLAQNYNCDITIACALSTVLIEDEKEIIATAEYEEVVEEFHSYKQNSQGVLQLNT